MQKSSYIGYIKDYEGATLMHVSITDDIIGFKCIFGGFRLFVIDLLIISPLCRGSSVFHLDVRYSLIRSICPVELIFFSQATTFLANLIASSSYTSFYCSIVSCVYTYSVGKLFQSSLSILYHCPSSSALFPVQCFLFFATLTAISKRDFLKRKTVKTNDKIRRFGVVITPLSR